MEIDPSNDGYVATTDHILEDARRAAVTCSPDNLERLASLTQLTTLLWERFKDTNECNYTFLDECIKVERQICDLCAGSHPNRARSCRNLAISLHTRFERLGDELLIDEAISLEREALSLTPRDHPDYAQFCQNLAASLHMHSQQLGGESLDEAISLSRDALSIIPSDHPNRALACQNLAASLHIRFEQLGDQSLLNEAVFLEREALSLTPSGHPNRAHSCQILAASLHKHFEHLGDELLLDEAIFLHRDALSLTPSDHPDRALSCQNLAASLHISFQQLGNEILLDEAIALHREGLSLTPRDQSGRAGLCRNLAASLLKRFEQLGDELLLDEAISLGREALSLTPSSHPRRALSCRNLAACLHKRFEQLGNESILDETIALHREALSLTPSGLPDHVRSCQSLAASLHTRFEQLGDQSLLDEAIPLYRMALSLTPSGHPDRAHSCRSLAVSLFTHFQCLGDELLLVEAISLNREALSLTNSDHPDRALLCRNLAASLHKRFGQLKDESLLNEAISLEREALSLTPSGHSDSALSCQTLAASLFTRFQRLNDEPALNESRALYKESIRLQPQDHPQQWQALTTLSLMHLHKQTHMYNMDLAIDYLCRAITLNANNLPFLLSDVGVIISKISPYNVPAHSRNKLLQFLCATLDLSSLVVGFILDRQSQLKYLRSCRAIVPFAYLCAALCDQKEFGLELLEHARAVMWAQLLHVREPQFEGIPQDIASELHQLLRSISTSGSIDTSIFPASYLTTQDIRYRHNTRINELLRQVRELPGQERFMRGLPFKHLARSAADHAIVVLIAGQERCHALILRSAEDTVEDLHLEHITYDKLRRLSVAIETARMRGAASDRSGNDRKMVPYGQPSFPQLLRSLWIAVVKPVLNHLHLERAEGFSRPRLHWCPTGAFTFLPLHAAGIYERSTEECCSDYVVSSYTPTLAALLRAQKSWPILRMEKSRLALVAAAKTYDTTLPSLPNVSKEMSNIISIAKRALISVDDNCYQQPATLLSTANSLKSSTLAHIACHGLQHPTDAISSGFCLKDGTLTVSHLLELDLKDAFFAFLSACETAKGDAEQPDQTVHLAAAMLFVGYRSVIATMWAMKDQDGPEVAKHFYERLFLKDQISLGDIPYALDHAVVQLRKRGIPPERWATFIHMGA